MENYGFPKHNKFYKLHDFSRISCAILPTPIQDAPVLAKEIGIKRLLIKRDDNTGLAMGGNKARKLEFLMAEAVNLGADVVLACGGVQSNFVRMTAAISKKLGMECIIFVPEAEPDCYEGNLLLDVIFGAKVRFLPGIEWKHLEDEMDAEFGRLKASGRKPYLIPVGGSTPLGALGYVGAVEEAKAQLDAMDVSGVDMVTAMGSGGTLAGLLLGAHMYMPDTHLTGISVVLGEDCMRNRIMKIATQAAEMLDVSVPDMSMMTLCGGYVGEAYGIPTPEAKAAILLTAQTEGILLDPVYTGKAMAGLIDLARKGEIGSDRPVLFWHTGGATALFAHAPLFREEIDHMRG
ncbi:MAG: D-cysteine desulfhydrase family protein [Armatimonadota bacterium]